MAALLLLAGAAWAENAVPQPSVRATQTPLAQQPDASAKAATAQEAIKGLREWDKKLASLESSFLQTTSYDGVLISRSKGKLYYSQSPRLLRLDTLGENDAVQQTVVTDQKIIALLDEKGKEITTLSWKDWQESQPNKALFDFGNYTALLARHQAELFEETDEYAVLRLTPKTGEEYRLFLSLSKKDWFPKVIAIESDLMRTEAELDGAVKNQKLSAALFKGVTK